MILSKIFKNTFLIKLKIKQVKFHLTESSSLSDHQKKIKSIGNLRVYDNLPYISEISEGAYEEYHDFIKNHKEGLEKVYKTHFI